jgi:hypothetical protein
MNKQLSNFFLFKSIPKFNALNLNNIKDSFHILYTINLNNPKIVFSGFLLIQSLISSYDV